MQFLCIQDATDNGSADRLAGKESGLPGTIVRNNFRRDEIYTSDPPTKENPRKFIMNDAAVKRLVWQFTGFDSDALNGVDEDGKAHPERREEKPIVGFFDCFQPHDEAAVLYLESKHDELVDIVWAKIDWLKKNPPVRGWAKKSSTFSLKKTGSVEALPSDKVGQRFELDVGSRKVEEPAKTGGRKPMSPEARKAAGERLKAAREKKREATREAAGAPA